MCIQHVFLDINYPITLSAKALCHIIFLHNVVDIGNHGVGSETIIPPLKRKDLKKIVNTEILIASYLSSA